MHLTAEEINHKWLLAENNIGGTVCTWQYGEATQPQQIGYRSWAKAKMNIKFLFLLQYNDERTPL